MSSESDYDFPESDFASLFLAFCQYITVPDTPPAWWTEMYGTQADATPPIEYGTQADATPPTENVYTKKTRSGKTY